jgi:hypothetical protein
MDPLTTFFNGKETNNALGLYFGDQISFLSNLHMHAGGRLDVFEQNRVNASEVLESAHASSGVAMPRFRFIKRARRFFHQI